jgi:large subunit ribosomal protein L19e
MNLKNQRRIAAKILKVGKNRVWFDNDRLPEIKEAITKADIKSLVKDKAIQARPENANSRFRIKKNLSQKRKGRKQGKGSRKGKKTARLSGKKLWTAKVRTQRVLLKSLKEKQMITPSTFRELYAMSKGGYFRSRRHIKLYMEEHKLIKPTKK